MATQAAKKWEEVQKKAFTHWVNSQLAKRQLSIDNLLDGFSNGVKLIGLVEILSGRNIKEKWIKDPKLKHHKITNCFIALKFLQEEIKMTNLTISAEDIVNADRLNLVLGFCWILLRFFQSIPSEGDDGHKEKSNALELGLLKWCQDTVAPYDIKIGDGFKSESFHNGKVLLALINEYDKSSNAYSKLNPENKLDSCNTALQLGESVVGIPGDLIDPDELVAGTVSDNNMVLYLSLLYNAFKEKYHGQTKESMLKRIAELEARLKILLSENEELKSVKGDVELHLKDISKKLDLVTEEKSSLLIAKEQKETELGSLKETYSSEKHELNGNVSELEQNIHLLKSASGENQTQLESAKEEVKKERDTVKEELHKTKDKLSKEREEVLLPQQEELISNLKRAQKAREELEDKMRQKQEENTRTIHLIRKHLLQHVRDMHVWKVFLDQDKEYEAENLHIVMEPELEALAFSVQMTTLDKAITEENTKLDELHHERIENDKRKQTEELQTVPLKKEEPKAGAPAATSAAKDKEKKKKKDPKKT